MDKNIPHDEKNCKDTLQSTQTQMRPKNLGSFLQSIQMAYALAYLKATLAMNFFHSLFIFE